MKSWIKAAMVAVAMVCASCSKPSPAGPTGAVSGEKEKAADSASAGTGRKHTAFHFNGKEYLLSFGGRQPEGSQAATVSLPSIPGAKLDNFVSGVHENSVTLSVRMPLDEVMAQLGKWFTAQGFSLVKMVTLEGMSSARWASKGGGGDVRVYAMEESELVLAKIIASRPGS